jgi:hypothetical protein
MPYYFDAPWSFNGIQRRPAAESEDHRGRPSASNHNQRVNRTDGLITQLIAENQTNQNRVRGLVGQKARAEQLLQNEKDARKALEARLSE